MNNFIFITLVLALGSVALNVILFVKLVSLTKEIRGIGCRYGDLLKTADDQIQISKNGNAIVKGIYETYQTMSKLQSLINEQCKRMVEQYERILDQYKHLAEAFKISEERYSDMYEEYESTQYKLEELAHAVSELHKPFWCGTDWADDADDSEYEFMPVCDHLSDEETEKRREAVMQYVAASRPEEAS